MVPDEQQKQPTQEGQVAAELAALSARVESLERQLAELSPQTVRKIRPAPPPPPLLASTPDAGNLPGPNFAQHIPKSKGSLEDRIGSQLFSRIGIVALLIATTLFLKWAIDNHWIGPIGRVAAGMVGGTGLVLWSERFRKKGFP